MIVEMATLMLNDDNTGCHIFMAAAAYSVIGMNTFYS